MAATFQFCQDNGAAVGTPARGTTRTTGVTNVNWKSADSAATLYSTAPVTAGENSYTIYQFGVFTGTYNEVKSGIWQHTYGANGVGFGAGLTLKGYISGSGLFATPAQTANSALLFDMTSSGALSTGYTVRLGINGPEHTGKGVSTTGATVSPWGATAYTEYIATQLQTTTSAAAGDTTSQTFTFQWTEN
jgi:hypothetical protein